MNPILTCEKPDLKIKGFELFEQGKIAYKIEKGKAPVALGKLNSIEAKQKLLEKNKAFDLYFSIANPKPNELKKFKKKDIKNTDIIWLDIDRPYDEDETQTNKLLKKLNLFDHASVLNSGRGYWLFFKLSEPTEELGKVEDLIKNLEEIFKADNCHNIDRMTRLSGSINQKNKQKSYWISISEKTISLKELKNKLSTKDNIIHIKNTNDSYSEIWFSRIKNCWLLNKTQTNEKIFEKLKNSRDKDLTEYIQKKGQDWCLSDIQRIINKLATQKTPEEILISNKHKPNNETYFAVLKNIGIEYRFNEESMDVEFKENGKEFKIIGDFEIGKIINLSNNKFPTIKNWRKIHFKEGIERIYSENTVSPNKDYLLSLKKKYEKNELQNLKYSDFIKCKNTTEQELEEMMNFMVENMVRRATQYPCYCDFMFVFQGDKGIGKTKFLETLGGDKYRSFSIATLAEMVNNSRGAMLANCDEFRKTYHATQEILKSFITAQTDNVALKYRNSQQYHKTYILTGTTNELEFLTEQTDRRFLIFEIENIDFIEFRKHKEKFLAKALFALEGEDWSSEEKIRDRMEYFEKISRKKHSRYLVHGELEQELEDVISQLNPKDFIEEDIIPSQISEKYRQIYKKVMPRGYGKAMEKLGYESTTKTQEGRTRRVFRKKTQ